MTRTILTTRTATGSQTSGRGKASHMRFYRQQGAL